MRRTVAILVGTFVLLGAQTPSLIEQADTAFREGDLDRATTLARRALSRQPGLAHGHLILGMAAARRGDWPGANRHFQTLLQLDPRDPNGHFYLGQARLYQKQWALAARSLARALELGFGDHERAVVELAFAENEAGRPAQALERLSKVTPPNDAERAAQYYAVTGFAQAKLGHPRESIDSIRKARDFDPDNAQYWEFLISSLISTDQTQAALREAIRAQAKFPDHEEIQYLFALSDHYVEESPLAPTALRNLREANPAGPRVTLVEGMVHRKQGRNDEAMRAFEASARQNTPGAHLLLGILHKEGGDYASAEREYRLAERENPRDGQVLLELGKLSIARGEFEVALARLTKAVAVMPDIASVHYQLGTAYARLGQKDRAEHHLNLSRELDRRQAELAR